MSISSYESSRNSFERLLEANGSERIASFHAYQKSDLKGNEFGAKFVSLTTPDTMETAFLYMLTQDKSSTEIKIKRRVSLHESVFDWDAVVKAVVKVTIGGKYHKWRFLSVEEADKFARGVYYHQRQVLGLSGNAIKEPPLGLRNKSRNTANQLKKESGGGHSIANTSSMNDTNSLDDVESGMDSYLGSFTLPAPAKILTNKEEAALEALLIDPRDSNKTLDFSDCLLNYSAWKYRIIAEQDACEVASINDLVSNETDSAEVQQALSRLNREMGDLIETFSPVRDAILGLQAPALKVLQKDEKLRMRTMNLAKFRDFLDQLLHDTSVPDLVTRLEGSRVALDIPAKDVQRIADEAKTLSMSNARLECLSDCLDHMPFIKSSKMRVRAAMKRLAEDVVLQGHRYITRDALQWTSWIPAIVKSGTLARKGANVEINNLFLIDPCNDRKPDLKNLAPLLHWLEDTDTNRYTGLLDKYVSTFSGKYNELISGLAHACLDARKYGKEKSSNSTDIGVFHDINSSESFNEFKLIFDRFYARIAHLVKSESIYLDAVFGATARTRVDSIFQKIVPTLNTFNEAFKNDWMICLYAFITLNSLRACLTSSDGLAVVQSSGGDFTDGNIFVASSQTSEKVHNRFLSSHVYAQSSLAFKRVLTVHENSFADALSRHERSESSHKSSVLTPSLSPYIAVFGSFLREAEKISETPLSTAHPCVGGKLPAGKKARNADLLKIYVSMATQVFEHAKRLKRSNSVAASSATLVMNLHALYDAMMQVQIREKSYLDIRHNVKKSLEEALSTYANARAEPVFHRLMAFCKTVQSQIANDGSLPSVQLYDGMKLEDFRKIVAQHDADALKTAIRGIADKVRIEMPFRLCGGQITIAWAEIHRALIGHLVFIEKVRASCYADCHLLVTQKMLDGFFQSINVSSN